jgi:hypothetical protein
LMSSQMPILSEIGTGWLGQMTQVPPNRSSYVY